jgi:hypothetical protein
MGNIKIVLFAKCYSGEQIKMNEMDESSGKYEIERRCIQVCGGET